MGCGARGGVGGGVGGSNSGWPGGLGRTGSPLVGAGKMNIGGASKAGAGFRGPGAGCVCPGGGCKEPQGPENAATRRLGAPMPPPAPLKRKWRSGPSGGLTQSNLGFEPGKVV